MHLLTISSLYPNNNDLKHGVFVETRLRHLIKDFPDVKATVIAPVPWFPFSSKKFGEYAKYAGVVQQETRHDIEIYHPKYLAVPKIGMYLTPIFMQWAITRSLKKLQQQGKKFDLIDGHYFYPDGVAIAKVAEEYNLPFTCTARGTDINLIPQIPKARVMIQAVFKKAAHMMTVCQALKDEMLTIDAAPEKVTVLRNGVDLNLFTSSDESQQQQLKTELGISGKLVMSVGWLIERKGHYLVIDAIKDLDNTVLAIAGNGPDLTKLQNQVHKLGLHDKVIFLGALPQPQLNFWFKATDVSVLASSREGWANVLLESMASGTPVVATRVWGTPEVVTSSEAGVLVERTSESIAKGIKDLLDNPPQRQSTRQYAENFDWYATSLGQYEIFKTVLEKS
ncbi:glycosyltransferase family 4 protein [Flavobacterium sp. W21_SRS_FM6]|uniref:glycosyltransferase family 4 protein n=1 Tax=Flavobacterium sp. W21_SRS_FM6 TaxID=3240268 RepID=UPI003F8EA11F